jgi:hypothetical protein
MCDRAAELRGAGEGWIEVNGIAVAREVGESLNVIRRDYPVDGCLEADLKI